MVNSGEHTLRTLSRLVGDALLDDLSFASGVVDAHDLLFCIAFRKT